MYITSFLAALAALSLVQSAPTHSGHTLHQKRNVAGSQWVRRSRVDSAALLPIRIALKQRDLHKGYDWVMDVSDPSSANFGKHWSEEDVNRAFAPAEETVRNVVDWLVESGIEPNRVSHSDNRGWIAFNATAKEAEALFLTEFHEHEHMKTGSLSVACDGYYLPHHLTEHVDFIKPGVVPAKLKKRAISTRHKRSFNHHQRPTKMPSTFPQPPSTSQWKYWNDHGNSISDIPADLVNCSTWITPPCVRALYDIPLPSGKVSASNSLGVFEEGDYYAQEDLDLYFTTFFPTIPNGTHPIPAFIDGAYAPVPVEDAGGESDLDLTLIYPLIYPQTITLYQTDDAIYATEALNGTLDGFLDTFLDALDGSFCTYSAYGQTGDNSTLDPVYPDPNPGGYKGPLQCGVYKPTNVISASYLGAESELPVNYQERQCNEWMKLALQGHTILFASGDYGVASFPDGDSLDGACIGNDNGTSGIFNPAEPISCPYVTAVGATQIPINGTIYSREVAANSYFGSGAQYTSGGGFSNIFAIPSYQQSAVAEYFRVQDPPYPYYETLLAEDVGANGGLYNRIGRGFPDISAVGLWWLDFNEGEEGGWGGTSMATPIVASVINRIVEERLAVGKGPIGFLNPTIYANPDLLHDVVDGNNAGCGTQGFKAAPGWDPVTGLGTPNYPALLEYFLGLP